MKKIIQTMVVMTLSGASIMANAACDALYDHQLITLQGKTLNLCDYQDKPILVVNTASKCGFTPQFESLENLYKKYKDQGLLVVGFPSNDFRQDPGNDKEIGDFCKMTYGVEFPMIKKSAVSGKNANPFYQQLAAKTGTAPQWNFYKYLVLPGGKVSVHTSMVAPESSDITGPIKANLK